MQKLYGACLACILLSVFTYAQDNTETTTDYTRPASIGVYFFLSDFKTANDIRTTSLNSVLDRKQFGKIKEMSPGLAVTYMKGISNHLDYAITASGTFVDFAFPNRPTAGTEKFFLEVDASAVGKMFTDRYWLIPTINLGVGASKYGSYFGAYIPAGVGLQLNFFREAYFIINSQYRIPITETQNYHFYHSIGITGKLGKRADETTRIKKRPGIPFATK
jgi:OmpA-OmpF porin, OOP family